MHGSAARSSSVSGADGHYLASDANALAGYADKVVYLNDRQLCMLTGDEWEIRDQDLVTGVGVGSATSRITWATATPKRATSRTSCSRRFTSSPRRVANAMRGRLDDADATAHFGGLNLDRRSNFGRSTASS